MNYVAHAFLAPREPIAVLGNMLGDFVKGPLPGGLAPELADAVSAHRALDMECDRHAAFVASRRRLFGEFSHYAGVIVDVIYDHLLFHEWSRYSKQPYDEFVEEVYRMVHEHHRELPTELAAHGLRLVEVDAFRRYRSAGELREALRRLSRRLQRPVDLAPVVDRLDEHRQAFADEFVRLFDDLTAGRAPA